MNIYQITKKIWYFLALIVIGVVCRIQMSFSQSEFGLPYIQNFNASQILQRGNNTSICQDSRSFLYVGSANGILEFDGYVWRQYETPGIAVIAATATGQVVYGGFNTLGVLGKSARGTNVLTAVIDTATLRCGQITSIVAVKDGFIFCAENEAFSYSEGNGLTKIFSGKNLSILSCASQALICSDQGTTIISHAIVADTAIVDGRADAYAFADGKNFLFLRDSLFVFSKQWQLQERIRWQTESANITPMCALTLPGGNIAVGTKNRGVYVLTQHARPVLHLSVRNGLQNNRVNHLFLDDYNNLWIASENGISRVEISSAYSFFKRENGLDGKVTSIVRFNGAIYASTSTGTYLLSAGSYATVTKIFDAANLLFTDGNTLYAGTENGLYADVDSEPKRLIDGNVTEAYIPKNQKMLFYLACENVVHLLRFDGKYVKKIKQYGPFPDRIRSMAYDDHGNLWMGTKFAGLFVARSPKVLANALAEHVGSGSGLPGSTQWIDAEPTAKGVVFSTDAGIYRYDNDLDIFYKDKTIPLPAGKECSRIFPIVEDSDKNLWLGISEGNGFARKIAVAWNIEGKEAYTLINQPFSKSGDFVSDVIFPDSNFEVWFGGYEGIMRLDFKNVKRDSLVNRTYIRSVFFDNDSLICESPEFLLSYKKKPLRVPPRVHSVRFDFVSPYYASKTAVRYQYRLEGLDKKWSPLAGQNYKIFDRLSEGAYTFRVRSIDELGNYSESATFSFTITDPFYQSSIAFLLYGIAVVFVLLLFRSWRSYLFAKEKLRLESIIFTRTEDLLLEKEKTERLLSNILPERTVKELKDKGRAQSMRFDIVTVLFSDIQGFTRIAEQMNPDTLVDELDRFFLQFDGIVEQYNIEKIKTIGDAYMCAGGIPQKNRTNPLEVIIAALEIQHYIRTMQEKAGEEGKEYWGLRIGIHTGPVVAGVIGSKKFTYDIWGDSVNIASRMESSGEVGRVNISEDTYLLVNEYFDCEYRGKMPVKYKGEIAMYFVNGFKAHLTEDPLKVKPNKAFLDKLALLRYDDLEDYILDHMEEELPINYYYHNIRHTIDVIVAVEILARGEGITDEELLLLKIAALFHDSGFLVDYHEHEQLSIQYANEMLPKFGYTQEQIRAVGDLIYGTRLPAKPKNKLEEIMCDADLDYLGRSDYQPVSRDLFRELVEMGLLKKSELEWTKLQVKFLQSHTYFTDTAKFSRENNKKKQLKKLVEQNYSYQQDESIDEIGKRE